MDRKLSRMLLAGDLNDGQTVAGTIVDDAQNRCSCELCQQRTHIEVVDDEGWIPCVNIDEQGHVTAAAIARRAGVGRAAVSNWRRRYADFPQPVGGSPSSPVFS